MNEIELLLAEKESALQQVKRQIEALRRSAALLAEPNGMKTAGQTPAIVAATAEPSPARADVLGFTREGSAQSKSNVPNYVRFSAGPNVFPPANEGIIVCDGCGHRNPDFLLDCERCDLPIRLRP